MDQRLILLVVLSAISLAIAAIVIASKREDKERFDGKKYNECVNQCGGVGDSKNLDDRLAQADPDIKPVTGHWFTPSKRPSNKLRDCALQCMLDTR